MEERRITEADLDAAEKVKWDVVHATHRAGEYKGWFVLQLAVGGVRCYLPTSDMDMEDMDDLDYVEGYFSLEWETDKLPEMLEFIDSYDQFEETNAQSLI